MDALGFKFKYVYDTIDDPGAGAAKVLATPRSPGPPPLLRRSRIGMMGYRDMRLYATLVDGVSLRRVVGVEVDVFETLEVAQRMALKEDAEVQAVLDELLAAWEFEGEVDRAAFDQPFRMYLAVTRSGARARLSGCLLDRRGRRQEAAQVPARAGDVAARRPR